MGDQQTDHTYQDMLLDAISGRWMNRRERIMYGSAAVFAMLWELALAIAPVYVYVNYGFEPGVIAGLTALIMVVIYR